MIDKIKTIFNKVFNKVFSRDKTKYYFVSGFAFNDDMQFKAYFNIPYKRIGLLNRKDLVEDLKAVLSKTFKVNLPQNVHISYYKELTKKEYEEFIK